MSRTSAFLGCRSNAPTSSSGTPASLAAGNPSRPGANVSQIATSAACCRRESSIAAYANEVARVELELVGAGGEPVDFWRTVNSHGLNDLVPNRIDSVERTLELTLYPGPQTVLIRKADPPA